MAGQRRPQIPTPRWRSTGAFRHGCGTSLPATSPGHRTRDAIPAAEVDRNSLRSCILCRFYNGTRLEKVDTCSRCGDCREYILYIVSVPPPDGNASTDKDCSMGTREERFAIHRHPVECAHHSFKSFDQRFYTGTTPRTDEADYRG